MKPVAYIQGDDSKTLFGFWLYLMTDLVIFGTLFATYAVFRNNTFGGPSGSELFSMPFLLVETLLLLTSSFTAGLALLAVRRQDKNQALVLFGITFMLGAAFLAMELTEFRHLIIDANTWRESAFLSAFFTLVGTHGLHVLAGLIWTAVMMFQIIKRGLTASVFRRLSLLNMFWHFLDIIWIFIFTFVYLMGVIK